MTALLLATLVAAPVTARDIRYGPEARNLLDVYAPPGASRAPVMIFVHGGGWRAGDKRSAIRGKDRVFTDAGWVLVAPNYRLVPQGRYPLNAQDVAAAVGWVRKEIARWGGDPGQVFISGHSAGAHLAACVATDPALLARHRMKPSDLRGVVLLDGAAYDIPLQVERRPGRRLFEGVFGTDPREHAMASPTLLAAKAPSLPDFLLVVADGRRDSREQSEGLAKAVRARGATAEVHESAGKDHAGVNTALGNPRDPQTVAVFKFLNARRGEMRPASRSDL